MRHILLFVLFAVVFSACTSEDVIPVPSLSDRLAGEFEVTSANFQGTKINLPMEAPGLRLAIRLQIIRKTETVIDLNLITETTMDGTMDVAEEMFSGVELFENENEIVLSYQGSQMGSFADNTLRFETDDNGASGSFTATKK